MTVQVVLAFPLLACTALKHPDNATATDAEIREYYQGKVNTNKSKSKTRQQTTQAQHKATATATKQKETK